MMTGLLSALLLATLTLGLSDANIATLAREVLARTGSSEDFEAAAFVVRAADGTLRLLHWPLDRAYRSARWDAPLPDGVVAVVHTHPRKSPLPSRQDRLEARRLGVPFYVVSRATLCMTDSSGQMRCAENDVWRNRNQASAGLELRWKERLG